MEAIERSTLRIPVVGTLRIDPASFGAWLLPVVLIVYLALNNGGYDDIQRSEVGIAVWWMVLVGTVVGALPIAGGTRAGRIMLGVLAAFAAWNALSLTWTESSERTAIELARVTTYLGVFALALAVQGGERWRYLLHGVTAGIAIVCGVAVLSRMEPTWFPGQHTEQFVPGIGIASRLAYPLNYSSGLGAFAAIGLPLLVAAASSARSLFGQACAAAALPVVALTLWLTSSSLSLPAVLIALIVFLALAPDRVPKLATLLIAGAGSAVLFAAEDQRGALDASFRNTLAQHQGHELLVITIVVCAGVALVQTALGLLVRYGPQPALLRVRGPQARVGALAAVGAVLIVAVVAGLPGELSDKWDHFKGQDAGTSPTTQTRSAQILDFSSSGRYQYWQAAVDAEKTDPLRGIGPGTFEYWYSQHGTYPGFVRDAHSLYIETLGELGIVGFLLIGGFSLVILAIGAGRALRGPPDARLGIAAATAGCAAFMGTAMVDWTWELGVLPVTFLALAALAVSGGSDESRPTRRASSSPWWRRNLGALATGVLSAVALIVIALPLAGADAIDRSQSAAGHGNLTAALSDARQAAAVQPYAAAPRIQEALILEQLGDLPAAVQAAHAATRKEAANWRNWVVLSRLEARSGNAPGAVAAYRRAAELNPRSGILASQ